MKKKALSLLLCIVMTASTVLIGCSNEKTSASAGGNGKDDEFITVDVFDTLANYQGIQSGWFGKIVKDKFNMELNIIAPNVAGGGDTLFQTRSAAGNLGDLIISKTESGRFENMVKAGLLMDMTDLLKDKAVLKDYKDAIENMNTNLKPVGIYGIPSEISNRSPNVSTEGVDPLVAPYVRWDAYKAAGYPAMESLEDWIPVMKQMQENTPKSDSGKKTYAISLFKDWDDSMMVGAKNYASLYGYNEIGFVLAKADGSDNQEITSSDGYYVGALEFLFHANQEGLIDPESTTQNYDILSDKYRDGQILTSLWSFQGPSYYNTVEHKNALKGFMPAYIKGISPYSFGCYTKGNGKTIIAIGSQTKYAKRLAEFIDWIYSPEGMEIVGQANGAAGMEGLTWEIKDGKAVFTEFGEKALPNNNVPVPEEWGGGSWKDGVPALNFKTLSIVDIDPRINEPYLTTMWSSELAKRTTPLDLDWQEKNGGAKTTIEFLESKNALSVAAGTSYLQPEESSDITTLRGQCKSVIVDDSWKMIFAKDETEFKSILKHMQDTVKGLGYEKVLEVDMKNANDQADSRIKAVEEYNNKAK
ncbi:ABC transporter substrate-binding protein [Lacrimispora algidixylanolytica]|uniref:ABC transporter substrate-binding protein n=1 Tax=Lacrimispora algidixylanolytica TaxID=94868 RepID=A0A419T856_9FIRM|nr:extracellular solute-binding protein [Lacrimispora algidixylanolytica]RKD33632.1 ABC transporter substrate-binding protein [Lacrimispora algidixylanolytica]